jgi:hypothetical protein
MDDGADLTCQLLFSHPEVPGSFDELFNSATTTCTHTHSCNPPGPSGTMHTHTCLHTHTQVFAGGAEVGHHYWNRLPGGRDVDFTAECRGVEKRVPPGENA